MEIIMLSSPPGIFLKEKCGTLLGVEVAVGYQLQSQLYLHPKK